MQACSSSLHTAVGSGCLPAAMARGSCTNRGQQLRMLGWQPRGNMLLASDIQHDTFVYTTACCCLQVVMLAFYFGSKEVDVFIAKQQRKQLGLCERCGGLYDPASCSQGNCPMKS